MILSFYVLAALAILFSLVILFSKNVLYSAFSLVIVFFCLAGIYIMVGAPFVGITQILIYIGGIIVFIVFGVMLTTKINNKNVLSESHNKLVGYGIGTALLIGFIIMVVHIDFEFLSFTNTEIYGNDVEKIGILLMSDYLIPFEISGVLLLIALIGATVVAGRKKEELI